MKPACIFMTLILLALNPLSDARNVVSIDLVLSTDDTQECDTLYLGGAYQFRVWIGNDFVPSYVTLGFRITSDDGATWQWESRHDGLGSLGAVAIYPESRMGYPDGSVFDMSGGLLVNEADVDGISPDTLWAGGMSLSTGLSTGPLEPMYGMHFSLVDMPGELGHICIDSSFVFPSGTFGWDDAYGEFCVPEFKGPFCWPVKRAMRGDFDLDGQITVGDAVNMISVIFKGMPHPLPYNAGDANCDGSFNVGDAIYLIAYIFKFGPAPECP